MRAINSSLSKPLPHGTESWHLSTFGLDRDHRSVLDLLRCSCLGLVRVFAVDFFGLDFVTRPGEASPLCEASTIGGWRGVKAGELALAARGKVVAAHRGFERRAGAAKILVIQILAAGHTASKESS